MESSTSLFPYLGDNKESLISQPTKTTAITPSIPNDIAIYDSQSYRSVAIRSREMMPRAIVVHDKKYNVSSIELMRMIKRLTQEIGDRKQANDLIGNILIPALRNARGELVTALEKYFSITWKIDDHTGQSIFYR